MKTIQIHVVQTTDNTWKVKGIENRYIGINEGDNEFPYFVGKIENGIFISGIFDCFKTIKDAALEIANEFFKNGNSNQIEKGENDG